MSTIKSFKAIRPNPSLVDKVAALPYDVMSEAEAREMVKDNPYSYLHIDRSEVDLPLGTDPHTAIVYEKAAENLEKMLADNTFIKENKPCLYIYKLTMNSISQTGLVASTSVDEYLEGTIKKHEFTRPEKEEDRINHIDYCDANTSPIFMAYKGKEEINSIIKAWQENNSPVYNFVAEDGIGHAVWVIKSDEVCEELVTLFKDVESLYIADGHHRNASALKVALKRREENPDYTGAEEFNFYLSVIFPAENLRIMDYNRLVYDLNGHTVDTFLEEVSKKFYIATYKGNGGYKPTMPHQFGMFVDGNWYILTADEEIIPADTIGSLDVSILQNNLLSPILGIDDPRTSKRIEFIGGIRGTGELQKRVIIGDGAVAFSMYPTSMEELMGVADSNNVMPPKSTWFEPKLRSGLFIHSLNEEK